MTLDKITRHREVAVKETSIKLFTTTARITNKTWT